MIDNFETANQWPTISPKHSGCPSDHHSRPQGRVSHPLHAFRPFTWPYFHPSIAAGVRVCGIWRPMLQMERVKPEPWALSCNAGRRLIAPLGNKSDMLWTLMSKGGLMNHRSTFTTVALACTLGFSLARTSGDSRSFDHPSTQPVLELEISIQSDNLRRII